MVTPGPDQPSHGHEFPPLENSLPADPYAPVDYPPDSALPPPVYPAPPGYPPPPMPPSYQQYPAGYPYGYHPYHAMRATGTNGKAIASLVTSLVGLACCGVPAIVGVILGVIAMRETKQTGQQGHGLALAGVIIGGIVIAFMLIGFIFYAFAEGVSTSYSY